MGLFTLSKSRRKPNDTASSQSLTHQNRLSKPKTNTNSLTPALCVDSPTSVCSRQAELLASPSDKESASTTCSEKEVEAGEPATYVRGRSSTVVSRSNSVAHKRTSSLSCFGGRRASVNQFSDSPTQENSLASSAQMDVESAIRLLQEVKKNASPEDLAALRAALESSPDVTIPAETELSRQTTVADRSSSFLTRRRSVIQTPGVATRNPPVEGHRMRWRSWKIPQIEPEQEAKWRVNPSHAPCQTRLAALDLAEDDSNVPTIRAQTPGDMEYCQLGTFKLGTLAVINGAPSPAPSTVVSTQTPQPPTQDDYFPPVDSSPSLLTTKSTNNRSHARSKSSILPTTPPLYRAYQLSENEIRTRSKLRHNLSHEPRDNRFTNASSQSENTKCLPVSLEDDNVPHNAIALAQEYQAGIPSSPFKKRYELDDNAGIQRYASEDSTLVIGAVNDSIPHEPAAMTEAPRPVELDATTNKTISQRRRNLLIARPPARSADTADSGYSSGSSLRLTHEESRESQHSTATGTSAPTAKNMDTANVQQRVSPLVSILKVPSVKSRYSLAPNEPTRDAYPRPASLQISSEMLDTAVPSTVLSPKSPRSAAPSGSPKSASPKMPKRLQKRRQSQTRLPVVQTCQSIREDKNMEVPEVPVNVRATFTQHLSQTPGIECLTRTYASTDHVIANEFIDDFPDPTPTEFLSQLAQSKPRRTPTPPPLAHRRSLSLFQKKKVTAEDGETEQEDQDPSSTVLDLGTVASALGCSPYDAAMSGSPKRVLTTAPTHPHQLGNTRPRAKSMVRMDAETAAELGRIRSKDHAAGKAEMPQSQRRRKSLHNLKLETDGGKASKRSARNSYDDIPPMPAIDKAKLQISHSAMPKSQREDHTTHKSDASSHVHSPRSTLATSELYGREHQNSYDQSQHEAAWEAQSCRWRQHRRQSIGDGLHAQNKALDCSAATVNFRTTQTTGEPIQQSEEPMAWDRYSGGLDFAYEGRRAGVGGSAGTRQAHSHASPTSMHWKHQYGVDLSDVPIFLQRA